ncbi:MAG: hypothetical protein ACRD3P_11985 [Terriglobales bacterium]
MTDSGSEVPKRPYLAYLEAVMVSAAAATLVFLIQWRYGFNWGDEGWLWYISQRVNLGEVPIRDVFSYDPGRYYWSAVIFKILGRDGFFEQLLANYLFGIFGLAITYVSMSAAGVTRAWRVSILVLLAVILGFPRHKVYEQTLSLVAAAGITFLLTRPEKLKRWFVYGVATGLAAFIGKNSGLYFVIAFFLTFLVLRMSGTTASVVRIFGSLCAGIIIGYSPMLLMAVYFHGFASAFWQSVILTRNWSWSVPIPFPWSSHAHALRGLDLAQWRAASWLCVAVPLTYAFIFWRGLRHRAQRPEALALGASIAGIPYLNHAFHQADFPHIAQGVVPFVVAVGVFCYFLWIRDRRRWSVALLAALYFLVLACWLPMEPLVQHLRTKAFAPQTLARIELGDRKFEVPVQQAEVMQIVQTVFRSCGGTEGGFFEAPFYPGLYAFLRTRAPSWDTDFFWPRNEYRQQQEIGALIQNRTSLLLINKDAMFDGHQWLKIAATNPILAQYLHETYQRASTKLPGGFELDVLPGSCAENFLRSNSYARATHLSEIANSVY